MDSKLNKYLDKDIKKVIASVTPVSRVAKTGQPYVAIEIHFINGYSKMLFLRSEEEFAWVNAIELADTNQQVDVNFE